ncbi:tetratricopeptide repeat protein, partial [Nocardia carnea]|uniref:tetratricopeptide repeat protein n=1 Tax=Nocardia carnea TaxID=37328 RepID=UPI003D76C112
MPPIPGSTGPASRDDRDCTAGRRENDYEKAYYAFDAVLRVQPGELAPKLALAATA